MIKFENVSFKYEDKNIINNLNLEIQKGEFLVIMGKNGSGKSTISKLSNGILIPNEGRILVDGIDTLEQEKIFEIRKKVGLVFQNPENQIVSTVVEEDIAFGLENMAIEMEEMHIRVSEVLEKLKLSHIKDRTSSSLSGGQKQRLAIAGVLAMKPEIIILDEPTEMLDPKGKKEVIETIRELNKEGITIVLITHNIKEAKYGSRIVIIDEGEVKVSGEPKKILSKKEILTKYGLDSFDITKLIDELSEENIEIDRNIIDSDDLIEVLCTLK